MEKHAGDSHMDHTGFDRSLSTLARDSANDNEEIPEPNFLETVRVLLELGVDANLIDEDDMTPFDHAVDLRVRDLISEHLQR